MLIRTGIYPCRNLDCDLYQFGKIENQFQFLPVGFEIPPDLFRISALASIFHGFVKCVVVTFDNIESTFCLVCVVNPLVNQW